MSKIKTTANNLSYGTGYVVSENTPERLTGKLLSVIETAGMPEKQETAIKDLIRSVIWEVFEDAVYISERRYSEIRDIYWEEKKKANGQGVPMSAI